MEDSVLTCARDMFGIEKAVVKMASQIQSITHENSEGRKESSRQVTARTETGIRLGEMLKHSSQEQADLGRIRKGKGMEDGKPVTGLFSHSS